jgi:predicted metal-dependent phosphoesterase TrpH
MTAVADPVTMTAPVIDPDLPGSRSNPLHSSDPIDLHLHTYASDGAWSPAELVDHLAREGFKVVAVCDHDTQRSVLEVTRLAAERGIRVIPGVEMTVGWNRRQLHLLVYGIAPDRTDPAARAFLDCIRDVDRMLIDMAEDARQRFEADGKPIPDVHELHGDRPMWPFHVLTAAIKAKHVQSLYHSARHLEKLGGQFSAELPIERVVDAAHQAGGICIIAHPGRADAVGILTEPDLDRLLATVPVDGIEAHYRSYTDQQTEFYRALAANRSLLVSCGSDSHASRQPVDPRPWRAAWCADLLRRLGLTVTPAGSGSPAWATGLDPQAALPRTATDVAAEAARSAAEAARSAAEAAQKAAEVAIEAAKSMLEAIKRFEESRLRQ